MANNHHGEYIPQDATLNIEDDRMRVTCSEMCAAATQSSACKTITAALLFTINSLYVAYAWHVGTNELAAIAFFYGVFLLYIEHRFQLYNRFVSRYVEWFLDVFQETMYRDYLNTAIILLLLSFVVFLCVHSHKRIYGLISLLTILSLSCLVNIRNVTHIEWNVVVRSLNLQFILAIVLFYTPWGRKAVHMFGSGVMGFLKFSESGTTFVYGSFLMDRMVFAFYMLSVIYLSFMTIAILRHIGCLTYLMEKSHNLSFLVGVSRIESVMGVVNMFMSMTETAVILRSVLAKLTKPELFSLMVSGLSTISFTALYAYVSLGANIDFLLTSCVLSIPCSFAFSRLFMPGALEAVATNETCPLHGTVTSTTTLPPPEENDAKKNILDKCFESVIEATFIIQMIVGNLIAVMSFVALADKVVEVFFLPFAENMGLLKVSTCALSYIAPFLGVEYQDAHLVAELFVKKTLINEFVAFQVLGQHSDEMTSDRSLVIANFLICGFGNISSAGMLTSVIYSLTDYKVNVSSMLLKSLCVACLVNVYCACTISILVE